MKKEGSAISEREIGLSIGAVGCRAGAAMAGHGPKVPGRAAIGPWPATAGPRDGGQWRRCRHGGGVLAGLAGQT